MLSGWQQPNGFPADSYFDHVEAATCARGIEFDIGEREEPWEYNLALWDNETAPTDGPMSWATHGLVVSWRCGEDDEPKHAADFTGAGWYWVPYTKPQALGDHAVEFELPYLAEPEDVAEAIHQLVVFGEGAGSAS